MPDDQYELCVEVLKRLDRVGVLEHVVLVGSWCLPCYKTYFDEFGPLTVLRTRDLDFAVRLPANLPVDVDLPTLLDDLNFIESHRGDEGYTMLAHPDLFLEFLVPERGRGTTKPFPLPQLGMNAQRLRYMDLAFEKTMTAKIGGASVTIPAPEYFALHKLLIAGRRKDTDKRGRDIRVAENVIALMMKKGDASLVTNLFSTFNPSWQKTIRQAAEAFSDPTVRALLS